MRLNFTNFHEISSEMVSFQIRSAPQFHQFSSKIAHFQKRNFVRNGQISNKERGVPGRAVSVADSLFRPHPEQRARASREPKEKRGVTTYRHLPIGPHWLLNVSDMY